MLRNWEQLPKFMKTEEVKYYYNKIKKRKKSLIIKRIFDIAASSTMLIVLSPLMVGLSIAIVLDSDGGVFFRQERITRYGKKFKIHKFRTMVSNAEKIGSQVTVGNDSRITRVGAKIRKYRLDELPQLIDVFYGDMSFVGTRPEVEKYVKMYKPEMYATLLLPAGITSETSIRYKDEDKLLSDADNVDRVYVEQIIPEKMKLNLKSIDDFRLTEEFLTMVRTVLAVLGKEYR